MKVFDIKTKATSLFQSICMVVFEVFSVFIIIAFVFEYIKPGFFSNWIDLLRVCLFVIIIGIFASFGHSDKNNFSVWKKTWKIIIWTLILLCLSLLIYNHIEIVQPFNSIILGAMCLLSISIPVTVYK